MADNARYVMLNRKVEKMNSDQIVSALADLGPLWDYEYGACVLCGHPETERLGQHQPDCPWHLAREWVAENGGNNGGIPGPEQPPPGQRVRTTRDYRNPI